MESNPYESPHESNPPPEPKPQPDRDNLIYVTAAILVAIVIPSVVIVLMCSAILNAPWLLGR